MKGNPRPDPTRPAQAKKWAQALANFVSAAVAYYLGHNLTEKFSQPGAHFLAQPDPQFRKHLASLPLLFTPTARRNLTSSNLTRSRTEI